MVKDGERMVKGKKKFVPEYKRFRKEGYKPGKDMVLALVENGSSVDEDDLVRNFGWPESYARDVLGQLQNEGKLVYDSHGRLRLRKNVHNVAEKEEKPGERLAHHLQEFGRWMSKMEAQGVYKNRLRRNKTMTNSTDKFVKNAKAAWRKFEGNPGLLSTLSTVTKNEICPNCGSELRRRKAIITGEMVVQSCADCGVTWGRGPTDLSWAVVFNEDEMGWTLKTRKDRKGRRMKKVGKIKYYELSEYRNDLAEEFLDILISHELNGKFTYIFSAVDGGWLLLVSDKPLNKVERTKLARKRLGMKK